MSDEDLYLKATKEVDYDQKDEAIWAKAVALVKGDDREAKFKYIELRVEQLVKSDEIVIDPQSEQQLDESYASQDDGLIPKDILSDSNRALENQGYIYYKLFAKLKDLPPEQVLSGIDSGVYKAKNVNGNWFVLRSENGNLDRNLGSNKVKSNGASGSFISQLRSGHLGLLRTFWLFGVVGGNLLSIPYYTQRSTGALILYLFLIYLPFMLIVYTGIWKAATMYEGFKLWPVLAKLWVILGWILFLFTAVIFLRMN